MTSPKFATDSEHGRYYVIPGIDTPLISVTNALGILAKFGLPPWYAKLAAEHAMDNLPALVARSRTDRAGCIDEIKGAAERARDSAADLGTRVHALAEAHLLGRTLPEEEGDAEAGLYVAQYLRFLKDFDVDLERDVVASEMTVAHPSKGYAGTLDAIVRLGLDGYVPGMSVKRTDERVPWLFDIKTSRTRSVNQTYPENHFQLAALRRATSAVIEHPDGSVELSAMPAVRGAAVLNLREKSYAFIPSTAGVEELVAFEHALALSRWLHDSWPGEYGYRPIRPSGRFTPKRGDSNDETSPAPKKARAATTPKAA